jgi:hypothetical protein
LQSQGKQADILPLILFGFSKFKSTVPKQDSHIHFQGHKTKPAQTSENFSGVEMIGVQNDFHMCHDQFETETKLQNSNKFKINE